MKTYKIHLIRHGFTQGNLDGRYIGVTDLPLCPAGREQLEQLAAGARYPAVQKVYASPLKRAVETAQILYPEHRIVPIDGLKEYDFGIFENRPIQELQQDPAFQAWLQTNMDAAPEGGETKEQFESRLEFGFNQVVTDMMQSGVTGAALITHAGVITALLAKYGLPQMSPLEWQVENGKGYTVMTYAQLWSRDRFFEVYGKVPDQGMEDDTPDYRFVDLD